MYDVSYGYRILGVSPDCHEEELEASYKALKRKYGELRYAPGEEGNKAAHMLMELDEAYREVQSFRNKQKVEEGKASAFSEVERLVQEGNYDEAQRILDNIQSRTPEWHYQQSIIFYKRNWYIESKKQLEMAVNGDPSNSRYTEALRKLEQIMASPQTPPEAFRGSAGGRTAADENSCGNSLPGCCTALCIADCCCDCMRCCF